MTIRARLTFWYSGVMFVSLLAMAAFSYYDFVAAPRARAQRGELAQSEVADDANDFSEFTRIMFWSGVPAAVLAVGGGWWLTRQALKPVGDLTRAAERINEQNLRQPIARAGHGDELDRLTDVFNAMTARLDSAFQRIREFTLHASHELKTPLTILRGELEMAEHGEGPATSPNRFASQIEEIDRLTRIVDGLTLLTKAGAGQVALHLEPVRLDELARECAADAAILAQPEAIRVSLTVCEETIIRGDRDRLRQLLLNLADNSVKYNHHGGSVEVRLRAASGAARFEMANTGPGLAADLQARVFEPFFRGDPSHERVTDGCGLGLSIAQWIVHAHDGSIQFVSAPGQLTTVTVTLPMTGPQNGNASVTAESQ